MNRYQETEMKNAIRMVLKVHALGRENAIPRREVLCYLRGMGFCLCDRTLRRTYADMPFVGYVVDGDCYGSGKHRGLFWIRTAREAKDMEETRRRLGKANMRHAKATAVAHANLRQSWIAGVPNITKKLSRSSRSRKKYSGDGK